MPIAPWRSTSISLATMALVARLPSMLCISTVRLRSANPWVASAIQTGMFWATGAVYTTVSLRRLVLFEANAADAAGLPDTALAAAGVEEPAPPQATSAALALTVQARPRKRRRVIETPPYCRPSPTIVDLVFM